MAEEVKIIVQVIDQASKEMDSINKKITDSTTSAQKSILDFSSQATTASLAFGAALGVAATGVVSIGADLQQASIAFETLTGSAEKATDLMKFLRETAINSPLDMKDAMEGAKRMLAFGFSAEKVKEEMPGLIDTVSALGNENGKLNSTIRALGQMSLRYNVTQQEFNQLTEQGINAKKYLAQAIKDNIIHVDGLSKGMMTLGGATKKQTADNTKASASMGVMAAQTKVMEDALNKAKSSGKKTGNEIALMEAKLNSQKSKMGEASAVMTQYGEANKDAGRKVNFAGASLEEIEARLSDVAEMGLKGKAVVDVIFDGMSKEYAGAAAKQVETFNGQVSAMRDILRDSIGRIMGWTEAGVKAGSIMDKLTQLLKSFNAAIGPATESIIKFTDWLLNNETAMMVLGAVILGLLVPAIVALTAPIFALIGAAAPFIAAFIAIGFAVQGLKYAFDEMPIVFALIMGGLVGMGAFLISIYIPTISAAVLATGAWLATLAATAIAMAPFILVGVALAATLAGIVGWLQYFGLLDGIILSFQNLVAPVQAIVDKYDLLGQKARDAAQAQRDLKAASDEYDALTEQYARQTNTVAQATLNHDRSVKDLEASTKKYKEGSPERVQAEINEKNARYNLEDQTKKLHEITGKMPTALEELHKKQNEAKASTENLTHVVKDSKNAWSELVGVIGNAISKLAEYIGKAASGPDGGAMFAGVMGRHAHGGMVNGPIDAPVPIIAHGGERVIPRTGVDVNTPNGGSGGLTINFNGSVSMDNEERVSQLAAMINEALGRQNELAKYGVGY